MNNIKECACWNIMNCKMQDKCPTRSNPEKPCWENCYLQNDFQKVFEICKNCHVFVNKKIESCQENNILG